MLVRWEAIGGKVLSLGCRIEGVSRLKVDQSILHGVSWERLEHIWDHACFLARRMVFDRFLFAWWRLETWARSTEFWLVDSLVLLRADWAFMNVRFAVITSGVQL